METNRFIIVSVLLCLFLGASAKKNRQDYPRAEIKVSYNYHKKSMLSDGTVVERDVPFILLANGKGCLIFNIEKDNGYLLSIVENSSIRQDGRYWTQNFLYAKEIISDFQHTENVANFCAALVQKVIEINPKRALDLAKASRSITQRLQENGSEINTTDLISSLALDEDTTSVLSQFRHDYEEKVGKIPDKFVCNQSALKRKTITKSNILRVGSGFEVKILDPSAEIDQGYDDEKGKSFLKLYF